MDDNGNIIYYVILGAIYLLSKVFGKKKKPANVPTNRPVNKPQSAERNQPIEAPTAKKEAAEEFSFEELLRELSGTPQPKPVADPEPMPAVVQEIESKPAPDYAFDDMDRIAVEMKVPTSFGEPRLPEPDPSLIKRKELTFTRGKNYLIEEKQSIDYLDVFNEENGAAKAFVLSEIFTRKYD